MDCESLFLKHVSVKKGNFDRESVAQNRVKQSLKKKKDEQNISMRG